MKRILTFLGLALISFNLLAATSKSSLSDKPVSGIPAMQTATSDMGQMEMDDFLTLTPKKYKEMTGKRMGVKQALKLKVAQKLAKKQNKGGDIPQGLYIVLAIFGLAWIGMGVMDNWEGNNWWINLILTLLFWLPGFIHALIKMGDYY